MADDSAQKQEQADIRAKVDKRQDVDERDSESETGATD